MACAEGVTAPHPPAGTFSPQAGRREMWHRAAPIRKRRARHVPSPRPAGRGGAQLAALWV